MKVNFKLNNPYNIEQKINLDINVSDKLEYDYSNCTWISIDTEFLSFNPLLDELCVIQIASVIENKPRVEVIYVYKKEVDIKLKELFTNKSIMKIFHRSNADAPRIEKYIGARIEGGIWDTYIGGKIAITNSQDHSMEFLIQYLIDPTFVKKKDVTSAEWDRDPREWEEQQFIYAALDVIYLHPLMEKIRAVADRRGKKELLEEVMTILPTISELTKQGYNNNMFVI